jgi:hypothetical protein
MIEKCMQVSFCFRFHDFSHILSSLNKKIKRSHLLSSSSLVWSTPLFRPLVSLSLIHHLLYTLAEMQTLRDVQTKRQPRVKYLLCLLMRYNGSSYVSIKRYWLIFRFSLQRLRSWRRRLRKL